MPLASHHDVAVIGLGPTGAVAAALLGQAGLSVLVVDKSRTLFDKPRAVGMDHEIMRVFQGMGIVGEIEPLTAPFTLSEHFGAEGQLIRRVGMLSPPYPMGWTPTMAFRQPQVEQILRDRLAALPSVEVHLGVELLALMQDKDGVDLRLGSEPGVEVPVRATYVIGCDGASSSVRRITGMTREDLGFDEPWLVIDLLVNESGLEKLPKVSTHFCEPARPSLFVVCTGNHRRWEMMLLPGEDPREMEREGKVWELLSRWITPDDAELWRRASYRFHAVLAREWRQGRIFLAGDAAHQQPPFLGQGMCQGVRDAGNLAWKLQQVMSGQAGDALLDTYAEERSEHVRSLITTIKAIGRYICELDPAAALARDTRLLAEAGGVVKTLVRQDLMPGLKTGFLSQSARSAHGTLIPQPVVFRHGRPVLLDDAAGGGWRVVLGNAALNWSPEVPSFMRVLRVATKAHADIWHEADGVLDAWLARHQCLAAIVRPDHYVYAVVESPKALEEELRALEARLRDTLKKSAVESC